MYTDATPIQAEQFVQAVKIRDYVALKTLIDKTYPEALWGSVIRSLSEAEKKWVQTRVFGQEFSIEETSSSPKRRERKPSVQQTHGHCADELMSEYGVPKKYRKEVCEIINEIWVQGSMIHCVIITSVRGYRPYAQTNRLRSFLERHATKTPRHHKR